MPSTSALQFEQVTKLRSSPRASPPRKDPRDFALEAYTAIAGIDLEVAAGAFVSVVGPSGCGKSTLLNLAAGLIEPSEGSVTVFGEPLTRLNRRAAYMFQQDALLPWETVLGNVTLGLRIRGVDAAAG